jgi:hypothetical protein
MLKLTHDRGADRTVAGAGSPTTVNFSLAGAPALGGVLGPFIGPPSVSKAAFREPAASSSPAADTWPKGIVENINRIRPDANFFAILTFVPSVDERASRRAGYSGIERSRRSTGDSLVRAANRLQK